MNCPRCKTPVGPLTHPDSIVTCPGCGSRLMTKSAARRSQGGPRSAAAVAEAVAPASSPMPASSAPEPVEMPPSATLPPTRAVLLGTRSAPASAADTAGKVGARRSEARPEGGATLDLILGEVRALRETQLAILDALEGLGRARPAPVGAEGTAPGAEPAPAVPTHGDAGIPGLSPIRARHRKSVLLVDDDPQTREAAVAELQHSDVPVRAYDEGRAAVAGIAEEKPDVIALEIGLGGEMAGKDLVNMVKATMEWVDVPIILWTREAIADQREAQIHGADEVVPKSGGAAALAARVITLFRHA